MIEPQIDEGTCEQVKLHDQELSGQQVRLIVLRRTSPKEPVAAGAKMLAFGMFPQSCDLTEKDFEMAEWA